MKHFIVLFVISSLFVCAAHTIVKAQKTNSQTFGIKGGINFSNLYVNDAGDNKMRIFAVTTYTTPDATNGVMSLYLSYSLGQN
ncbi:MAG TPA: hypothetical protein VFC67_03570 [Prolixibacteraceae bacterium]|nr:hypothetical protein [Prolixibacteraceae bacterium]